MGDAFCGDDTSVQRLAGAGGEALATREAAMGEMREEALLKAAGVDKLART